MLLILHPIKLQKVNTTANVNLL